MTTLPMTTQLKDYSDEELMDAAESAADQLCQYESECALFGDAGPGQAKAAADARAIFAEIRSRNARMVVV